ncbi:MAG: hypothetical protein ACOX0R_00605 [Candidatus Dojkabacteria bacterium]|jgi:hypothetical protein
MKKFRLLPVPVITTFFFLLFLPFGVMAQEDFDFDEEMKKGVDNVTVYENAATISDIINQNETKAQNVEKGSAKSIVGHSMSLLQGMCTTCFENSEELPEELKYGLVEKVDQGLVATFNSQPKVDVVAHLAEEWVPGYKQANSVYASGFDDLERTNIADIWSYTRNIAYVFYVVIMIVIGFMIMFRNKIGGQVMVTLGNSIPKLVLSLLLVTFSFAIIGIIIDIGGMIRNVIANLLYPDNSLAAIEVHNPFALFSNFALKSIVTGGTGLLGVVAFIKAIVAMNFAPVLIGILGVILSAIILIGAIKLWIVLLKAYFGILVNLVTAPFTILAGALPGNEASMLNTFKSAARNVLVFPIAFAIVNIPYAFEGRGIRLAFPETLVGVSTSTGKFIPWLIINIGKIVVIYVAATAPEIVKSIIPATAPKTETGKVIKENLTKIPLLGGMFK